MLEEKLKQNLADNLIRLRTARGITQEELALELQKRAVDIKRTALAAYENKRSFPRLDVLYTLSRFFDTDIEALLQEKDAFSGNFQDKKRVECIDLNELLQDYSEVLMYFRMYRRLYENLAEQIIERSETLEQKTEMLKLITQLHGHVQLETPGLADRYQEKLESNEILVFQGVYNGLSIEELGLQLQMSTENVAQIFIRAKEKVFDLLLED
jgi:transcriptional regulator with XRE-family HTH domain